MEQTVLFVRTSVLAARYLAMVRAALPRWMRVLVSAAMVCTLLPGLPDLGFDEAAYLTVGLVLWLRHRALVRTCWHAAQQETR